MVLFVTAKAYPSSSQHTKNWDKLAKEVDEEEKTENKEGDAALNDLFKKIYSDGSDEQKKAMVKSFVSTNRARKFICPTILTSSFLKQDKWKFEVWNAFFFNILYNAQEYWRINFENVYALT